MKNLKQTINEKLKISKDDAPRGMEFQCIMGKSSEGVALNPNEIDYSLVLGRGILFNFTEQGLKEFIEQNPYEYDGDYLAPFEDLLKLKTLREWTEIYGAECWDDIDDLPGANNVKGIGIRYK